ncbi:MAG: TIGR03067 domain-containing protein [Planctomycetes bacterium]|nr:TIGR03067 domain-containing protein [Planctomycetota bacterium]
MRCFGLTTSIVIVLIVAAASDEAVKRDRERFQGTWSLTSLERDGKKAPVEELKSVKLTIKDDKFVLCKDSVVTSEGTFVLDPTKKPKEIDETLTAGPNRGKVFKAIYEIDETRHTICFAAAGQERPTEFSSKPGSGRVLQVWQREK